MGRCLTWLCVMVGVGALGAVAVGHPPGEPRALPSGAVALGATVTREAGIEFVTIPLAGRTPGAANPAWPGNGRPDDRAIGRGSVGYEYRIGRYEVTTAQWVEFMNAALDRPSNDRLPHVARPDFWGASPIAPVNPGGQRFTFSAATAMYGTGDITWRTAAMYCNWLHNDKRTDRAAFLSGAYDVSTFTTNDFDVPNDQLTRSPGAKFFIPTLSEWVKAAHYDPSRLDVPVTANAGGAGYWLYPTGSDVRPNYAPPGVNALPGLGSGLGQSSGAWTTSNYPGFSPFSTPLGAYAGVMSPWGLFDTSGGTAEWTEARNTTGSRLTAGAAWLAGTVDERLGGFGDLKPWQISLFNGFRIAAAVPTPSGLLPLGLLLVAGRRRR